MKVLIALDDSAHSEYLLEAVTQRKWPEDTQFKIVTVIEPIDMPIEEEPWMIYPDELHVRRRARAELILERARHKIGEHIPHSSTHFEVREGDACCQLINAAVEWGANKIFMGAHAKSACPHNMLGSVSRAVSLHAPCSVEVVRIKQKLAAV